MLKFDKITFLDVFMRSSFKFDDVWGGKSNSRFLLKFGIGGRIERLITRKAQLDKVILPD